MPNICCLVERKYVAHLSNVAGLLEAVSGLTIQNDFYMVLQHP